MKPRAQAKPDNQTTLRITSSGLKFSQEGSVWVHAYEEGRVFIEASDSLTDTSEIPFDRAFILADTDQDSVLKDREVKGDEDLEWGLTYLDQNRSGSLERSEWEPVVEFARRAQELSILVFVTDRGRSLFSFLDKTGDGYLSLGEVNNVRAQLGAVDSDGDGRFLRRDLPKEVSIQIIRGQLRPVRRASNGQKTPAVPVWFKAMDRNGDGMVSRKEFMGPRADFSAADANKDGLLSPEESTRLQTNR